VFARRSTRLVGGTSAIVSALASGLPDYRNQLGARVTHVEISGQEVEVGFAEATGKQHVYSSRCHRCDFSFSPAHNTAMAQRWRDAGLSGAAQSMVGPCDIGR
jgi:hypothetical protein